MHSSVYTTSTRERRTTSCSYFAISVVLLAASNNKAGVSTGNDSPIGPTAKRNKRLIGPSAKARSEPREAPLGGALR